MRFIKFPILVVIAMVLSALTIHAKETSGFYWFDRSTMRVPFAPGQFDIPTDGLSEGIHSFNAFIEQDGTLSPIQSILFFKGISIEGNKKMTALISVDGVERPAQEIIFEADNMASFYVDLSEISIGLHSLSLRVLTSDGMSSDVREGIFMKVPSSTQLSTFTGCYFIDGLPAGQAVPDIGGDVFHLNLDLSSLTAGIHSVTLFLYSHLGVATEMHTAWFIKTPDGGEGVRTYEYWLNDNYDAAKRILLENAVDPFSIQSLLEMDTVPFRSENYRLYMENEQPVLYAKNDFHIRFYDNEGRNSTQSASFADMRVKYPVTDIAPILKNKKNKVSSLKPNEIKWYALQGEPGDSIGLCLNCGAMMELYDYEGVEIFSARGADAMKFHTHTLQNGNQYYLAVHDIPMSASEINIDYVHVDRFAMMNQTPSRSAQYGSLVMEIEGNGFNCMKEVVLVGSDGSRRIPDRVIIKDNYHLSLYFDLDRIPLEKDVYHLIAKFDDLKENNTVEILCEHPLTVEDGVPVEISVKIETPRIARTPYEVNVHITNHSNVGVWGVPIHLAFERGSKPYEVIWMNFVHIDPVTKDQIETIFYDTDNLLGKDRNGVYLPMTIPHLSPDETLTLTVGLITDPHASIPMYAWAGQPWSEEFKEILSPDFDMDEIIHFKNSNIFSARALSYLYCLANEMASSQERSSIAFAKAPDLNLTPYHTCQSLEDSQNIAENVENVYHAIAETISGISNGVDLAVDHATINSAGIDIEKDRTFSCVKELEENRKKFVTHPMAIVARALGYRDHYDNVSDAMDNCVQNQSVQPSPEHEVRKIDSYQSGDPNEITGFIAPSGSRYLKPDVKTITYDIEFENDPEISNAPASRIAVEDKLDAKMFDFASFRPLTMTIGQITVDLPPSHHFVKTVDMRPSVHSVAELTFDYDEVDGIASWSIRSLDPMTMEPVRYMDYGILPVNDETQRGVGHLTFSIGLNPLSDGDEVSNSAVIVFDDNEPISTPVFTNIADYSLPTARLSASASSADHQNFSFEVEGADNGSGIWSYALYCRPTVVSAWNLVKSGIEETPFTYTAISPLPSAVWTVVATDRAGNIQKNDLLQALTGDADGNGRVDASDVVVIQNFYTNPTVSINKINADVTIDGYIDSQDALATAGVYLAK